jgi:hypothetical protein
MVLEECQDVPPHGATCVPCRGGSACGCGLGGGAGVWRCGRTGHVEQALVLLLHL